MASIIQTYEGPLAVNYEDLRGTVKDIVSGGTRGIRREKPDIAIALGELSSCTPALAASLGIGPELLTRIATQTTTLAEVRAARVILDKLAEVFKETEACLEDEREGAIGLVVDSVRRASRQQPTALVSFEATVRYHGQVGMRAVKTRIKNKKLAAAAGEVAAPPAKAPEVDPKPATVDPKPATVDPKPAMLDPKPAMLDPEPATLDPKPATLDPRAAPVDLKPALVDPRAATLDPKTAPVDPRAATPIAPPPSPASP